MRRATLALLALLPLALGARCGAGSSELPPLRFAAPNEGQQLTHMPLRATLSFVPEADPGTLLVLLNGNDVTSFFQPDPPGPLRELMSAEGIWGPGFVNAGANLLEAWIDLPSGTVSATRSFVTSGDPHADDVRALMLGATGGFNQSFLCSVVTGPPRGEGLFTGSLDVVSLGSGGWIEMEFEDNVIVDGPGPDFTVFENAFLEIGLNFVTVDPFTEPGLVGVSQDGSNWEDFDTLCALDENDAPFHPGCAGVYPVEANGDGQLPHASELTPGPPIEDLVGVSAIGLTIEGAGGDSFDLADVGLSWARYVRIQAAPFSTGPADVDGFDIDAVTAIHSRPAVDANPTSLCDVP